MEALLSSSCALMITDWRRLDEAHGSRMATSPGETAGCQRTPRAIDSTAGNSRLDRQLDFSG
jgi:hypothetical protein